MSAESTLRQKLEALLFVATKALDLAEIVRFTRAAPEDIEYELSRLRQDLNSTGLRLSVLGNEYRLVTSTEVSDVVRAYLQSTSQSELTKPALETLAIVAYRGPISKTGIETIRGVASDTMLRNLLARGLIIRAGMTEDATRSTLYSISHTFLQQFGLTSQSELPPLPEDIDET